MSQAKKTNACRLLDQRAIAYSLRGYEVDELDLSADAVAQKTGLPTSQLYKTLCVIADDRALLLGVVAGDRELDLKALARVAKKRALSPVPMKDLFALTGYVRGGVTALACKKPYPVFLDSAALALPIISVSAGQRGLQILLSPTDYRLATNATVADISRDKI
ncbi:MAG TPA: aminoacyl-tRNA deacylase [Polyangiales bacterium]